MKSREMKGLIVLLIIGLMSVVNYHCGTAEMTTARLLIQERQWDEALRALERALEEDPENAEAWFLKGKVYDELAKIEEMLEAFDRASALTDEYDEDIEILRINNWALFVNRSIDEYGYGAEDTIGYRNAIELCRIAAMLEPDSVVAYEVMGYSYVMLGEYESAIEPFKELLKRDKDGDIARLTGQIYFDIAHRQWNTYETTDDPAMKEKFTHTMENSIEYLIIAIDENPNDTEAFAVLSNAYIMLDRMEDLREIFKLGLEADPFNEIYHYNLGVLQIQEDNFEEAVYHLQEATKIDPEYHDAYYNLGVAYVNWGVALRDEARESGDPDDKRYHEKFEAALPHLERVIEHRPNDPMLWETLGQLYANLDMVEEAERAFQRADAIEEMLQ